MYVCLCVCVSERRQLVGSFIQTQKYSVQRTLERRFRQFLSHGSDYHQLLLSLLQGLLRDVSRAARLTGAMPTNEYHIPIRCATPLASTHTHTHIHTHECAQSPVRKFTIIPHNVGAACVSSYQCTQVY